MFKYKKCHGRLSFVSLLILKNYHKKIFRANCVKKAYFSIGIKVAECGLFPQLIPQIIETKQCRKEINLQGVRS